MTITMVNLEIKTEKTYPIRDLILLPSWARIYPFGAMLNNLAKFINEGAKIMAIDRPDVWPDEAAAVATLSKWFSELNGDQALSIERAGWVLFKHDHDEGLTEYSLMRNVLDYTIDTING